MNMISPTIAHSLTRGNMLFLFYDVPYLSSLLWHKIKIPLKYLIPCLGAKREGKKKNKTGAEKLLRPKKIFFFLQFGEENRKAEKEF